MSTTTSEATVHLTNTTKEMKKDIAVIIDQIKITELSKLNISDYIYTDSAATDNSTYIIDATDIENLDVLINSTGEELQNSTDPEYTFQTFTDTAPAPKDTQHRSKSNTHLDVFFNPTEEDTELGDVFIGQMKMFFQAENFTSVYPNLFKLLWFSSTPCRAFPGITETSLLKVLIHGLRWKLENNHCYFYRTAAGPVRAFRVSCCSRQWPQTLGCAARSTWQTR